VRITLFVKRKNQKWCHIIYICDCLYLTILGLTFLWTLS